MLVVKLTLIACMVSASLAQCFPQQRGWEGGPNGTSLQNWWCGADDLYGFLGFSYPVEDDDCSDYSYNGFVSDFKKMKANYGATFVRLYLPVCYKTSFWVEMVKAARDTNMALIPMVFWDWQQNDPVMKQSENAILGIFTDPEVGSIAPYIIHSIAFGDELGEQGDYWLSRMKTFKGQLSKYGVPLTITDDWDRSIYRNSTNNGLNSFGQSVNALSDLTQAHVMPYYHPSDAPDAFHFWPYFTEQLNFLSQNNKAPIFVSQTCWAYNKKGHERGSHDDADNMKNYQEYWNTINSNCTTFKEMKISWFFHTWFGEPGFDLIGSNGSPVYNFTIEKC